MDLCKPNDDRPQVTVIVPVYNVEKYLKKCVDSILCQTLSNIEIILVNDGSTDNSGKICDAYSKKDERIKVYHKENGGLSSARNYGIEKANGKYLGFVDSDDYIDSDMYELLLDNLIKFDADMSLCGLFDMYKGKPQKTNTEDRTFEATPEEAIKIVLEAEITSVTAVNKLYKRELFKEVRYPEGKDSEDAFVIIDLLMRCQKTVISTKQKYYYIHRSGSITTLRFSPQSLHVLEAYKKNYKLVEKNYPALISVAKMRLCWANFNVLDRLIFDTSKQFTEIEKNVIRYIKNNYFFIMRNKYFTISRKISATALMFSKKFYRDCVRLHNKRYQIL